MRFVPPILRMIGAILSVLLFSSSVFAEPIDTTFKWQGTLNDGGAPANGNYDFQFSLWTAETGGIEPLLPITLNNVPVTNGQFIVDLDFGSDVFNGTAYWIEIQVNGMLLSPRSCLCATPYAIKTRGISVNSVLDVGIGTTTPGYPLHVVNSSSEFGEIGIFSDMTSTAPGSQSIAVQGVVQSASSPFSTGVQGSHAGDGFGVAALSESGKALQGQVLLSSGYAAYFLGGRNYFQGNVGIGTNTPAFPLDIDASGDAAVLIQNTGASGFGDGVRIHSPDFGAYALHARSTGVGGGRAVYGQVYDANAFAAYFLGGRNYLGTLVDVGGTPAFEFLTSGLGVLGRVAVSSPDGTVQLEMDGRLYTNSGGTSSRDNLLMFGPNGDENLTFGSTSGIGGYYVSVYGEGYSGSAYFGASETPIPHTPRAESYELSALVKNFREPHPDDPASDIVYACVEGPEAAMYTRGIATLEEGFARIELPRHFASLAMAEGMTVRLTPRSTRSFGLAVIHSTNEYIEVGELRMGNGTYEFDWEAKAIRRAFQDYQVIRPWDEHTSAARFTDEERWEARLMALERREQRLREAQGSRKLLAPDLSEGGEQ